MKYQFLRFPEFKTKAVTLSYDDATVFDRDLIKILDGYGLKCTFNVPTGFLGRNEKWLTLKETVELYGNTSHEVAVHGHKHLALAEFSSDVMARDIIVNREQLENAFGKPINGMAYAMGSFNDEVVETAKKCGIKYARTVDSTENFDLPDDFLRWNPTCHHANAKLSELTDRFLNYGGDYGFGVVPKLFYLWGHSYEFDDCKNWDIIENFAKKVGGRDDVWYATNGEICEYLTAFKSLVTSVDFKRIYNPTAKTVWLDIYGCKYEVKSGEITETKGI